MKDFFTLLSITVCIMLIPNHNWNLEIKCCEQIHRNYFFFVAFISARMILALFQFYGIFLALKQFFLIWATIFHICLSAYFRNSTFIPSFPAILQFFMSYLLLQREFLGYPHVTGLLYTYILKFTWALKSVNFKNHDI